MCVKTKRPKVKDINVVEISKKVDQEIKDEHEDHSDKECVWPLDSNHWGIIHEAEFFNGQIKVFVCDAHLEWHMAILALHKAGMSIEDIFALTKDECLHKAAKLLAPIVDM